MGARKLEIPKLVGTRIPPTRLWRAPATEHAAAVPTKTAMPAEFACNSQGREATKRQGSGDVCVCAYAHMLCCGLPATGQTSGSRAVSEFRPKEIARGLEFEGHDRASALAGEKAVAGRDRPTWLGPPESPFLPKREPEVRAMIAPKRASDPSLNAHPWSYTPYRRGTTLEDLKRASISASGGSASGAQGGESSPAHKGHRDCQSGGQISRGDVQVNSEVRH